MIYLCIFVNFFRLTVKRKIAVRTVWIRAVNIAKLTKGFKPARVVLKGLFLKFFFLFRLAPEVFYAAHGAHRCKQRVCIGVNIICTLFQIFNKRVVNQKFVSAAVDNYRCVPSAKAHNFSPFAICCVVWAFHLQKHTQLIGCLHIFLRRNICVKPYKIKPQFFQIFYNRLVIGFVVHGVNCFRKIAVLARTSEKIFISVKIKCFVIRSKAAHAELSFRFRLSALYL